MKTIALLAATLTLSLSACATDEERMDPGLPPLGKPEVNAQPDSVTADIEETLSPGEATTQAPQQKLFDDGRLTWAEDNGLVTYLHSYDETLGVDEISILDANGDLHCCVYIRNQPTEIAHAGIK